MSDDDHDDAGDDKPDGQGPDDPPRANWPFVPPLSDQLRETINDAIRPATDRFAEQMRFSILPKIAEQLRVSILPKIEFPGIERIQNLALQEMAAGLERITGMIRQALPENIRDLSQTDIERLHDVAAEQRIGIMWVPGADVVTELMAASTADERAHVVSDRSAEIVASCRPCLVKCDVPELIDLVALAIKAVDAFESGYPEPAQALATNVLDTSVTQYFGPDGPRRVRTSIAEVKKMAARSGTDEEYWRYLLAITLAGIPPAWWDREYGSTDPSYSRGGTIHCADLTVYSPANAARALSLATCLLRWMKQNEDLLTDEKDETD